MKYWVMLFWPLLALGQAKSEAFIIQVQDRRISVIAPESRKELFAVIVENRSLSDQVAKFTVRGKIIKYVSIPSGKSETVEIQNKSPSPVVFVPVSPAFQEVELTFGKKAYEIPSKE